jgi:predicted kinase
MITVMPHPMSATVHLLAGLNGAGKSTHARRLERECPAVRFTLDEWMLRLFRLSYDDPLYPDLSERCQDLMWDVAKQVLTTGTDVVLDWNLWSCQRRKTWRDKVAATGHRAVLHYVRVPVETAIRQVEARRSEGTAIAHALDADAVRHLARLFEAPTAAEGIEVRVVEG